MPPRVALNLRNYSLLLKTASYTIALVGKSPKPTDAELAILRVLWQRGPSTVRQVHEALNATKRTGYTTVLKFMQLMKEKGLVSRDEAPYAHVYQARLPKEQTQRTLVADLLDRAFEGSTSGLVLRALSTRKASPEELSEIRKILKDYERGAK
jgi:predicted transcriptional regulator